MVLSNICSIEKSKIIDIIIIAHARRILIAN